ncbi:transglycosylase SLT domain-containing protein [Cupriavidus sp. D39]|uniref:transglycosylase SLT domain-containing protein n=1 Tax=Cupriavidus sp. D39 TaxID=2997877 RepID=UPI0022709520|nr:transglycosylase SLT domain-containing protein [Cupriavidus sp. D39]MCY0854266.1 transglycosylase SLT domain-containing protein [Cupriavidus sp. D39]
MIERACLLATALAATPAIPHAATIEAIVSPTAVVVRADGAARLLSLPGKPVLYCGLERFLGWSAQLIGAQIEAGGAQGPEIVREGKTVPLASVFAGEGWLRPTELTEAAQEAMVERRGGWACAPKAAPFAAMSRRVDPLILAGIAMNESAYRGRPWPWTLNVAGRGMFFATREDAHATVNRLLAARRCDFDVGIMQINWCYHGQRFASPWEALAPATNIRVAETILMENLQRSGSAMKAIAWYHSADSSRGGAYFARFMTHFKQLDPATHTQ